jgi:fatty-acyl-CoA synthase
VLGTFADLPLTIRSIFEQGARVHARSRVVTYEGESSTTTRTFAEIAAGAHRLAGALSALGVQRGDRVASLAWNHVAHLEAYFAVPSMGAVLVTLNLRLTAESLGEIAGHAEPKVLLVDESLSELAAGFVNLVPSLEHVVVIGAPEGTPLDAASYEQLLAGAPERFEWPEVDESDAAMMCYTTGTTGPPKGVAYTHRSTYLHSLMASAPNAFAIGEHDRIALVVPMFHANAWGLPFTGWWMGADMLMPREFLQGPHLARLIETERGTFTAGVPTVLDDLLTTATAEGRDITSLRLVNGGGSAIPASLIERYLDAGIEMVQGWGMTETSPLVSISRPGKDTDPDESVAIRAMQGRPLHGVEMRIVGEDGNVLAWDGESVGELEVRGPTVTASYYREPAPERFDDGWLRTGDVGIIDPRGYLRLTDRIKDVIKSGGEWISSIELENKLLSHADVADAAVIGIDDERWGERPLACIVPKAEPPSLDSLRDHLEGTVPRWWFPESYAWVEAIPRTSVGKIDKNAIRELFAAGKIEVVSAAASGGAE